LKLVELVRGGGDRWEVPPAKGAGEGGSRRDEEGGAWWRGREQERGREREEQEGGRGRVGSG
jgi:hypothetical protein